MATRDHNRIDLLVHGRHSEGRAAGVIKPGHLIVRDANGEYVVNSVAAADVNPIFAKHDYLQGKTVDDAYADDDVVLFVIPAKGDHIAARIATGQDIANGGYLEAAGDGTLRAYAAGKRIARALEAVDNNPGTEEVFIKVEIL